MNNLRFRAWVDNKRFEYSIQYNTLEAFFGMTEDLGYQEKTIYQQWTGLKDSNKQDIYEGDIVTYDCGNELDQKYYANILTSPVYMENGKYRIKYSADSYNWHKMKIVGNIFETK